ncbi:MAG: extracellular solute-binding protein [Deltaproteobacteria bacterium]|nr:extracellular solute-binding protein [Deltaproteobacteria bacterium]
MNARKLFLIGASLLSIVLGWAPWAKGVTLNELVAAARKEGTIEFYGPSTLTPQGAQALAEAFNRKYGLNIKLNYSPAGDMPGDVARVVARAATGVAPDWDVMVVTDAHHATLWVRKLHQTLDFKALGIDSRLIHYDSGTISFANQIVLPAYNNKILAPKDAPKSWDDLLDPKWKGKLGMTNAAHHFSRLAAGPWGEKKTTDYVRALVKQDLNLGLLGQIYTRLQVGEILVTVTITDSFVHRAKKTGAPIVFAEGVEPVISPAYHAGVPKGAPHPNVGHLFSVFLTTLEAQGVWEKYGGQSSAFVPGTTVYKYAQKHQMVYMTQDQAEMVDKLAAQYGKILGFTK